MARECIDSCHIGVAILITILTYAMLPLLSKAAGQSDTNVMRPAFKLEGYKEVTIFLC